MGAMKMPVQPVPDGHYAWSPAPRPVVVPMRAPRHGDTTPELVTPGAPRRPRQAAVPARVDEPANAAALESLEQSLIAVRPLADLVCLVLDGYGAAFGADSISLVLVDRDDELARSIVESKALVPAGLGLIDNAEMLTRAFTGKVEPVLARFEADRHAQLFGGLAGTPAAVALIPIRRNGVLAGSLNLASRNSWCFSSAASMRFFRRLTDLLSICVENAIFHDRLVRIGLTDPLTGASNRRYFERRLAEEIKHSLRHGVPLSLLLLDLDLFKHVNDTFGHPVGDQVLVQAVMLMQAQLRGSDTFARYGGEEFVALLPDTPPEQAREIADRIRACVADHPFQVASDCTVHATVSIGLASFALDDSGDDLEAMARDIVARADAALYRAKDAGRDRVIGE